MTCLDDKRDELNGNLDEERPKRQSLCPSTSYSYSTFYDYYSVQYNMGTLMFFYNDDYGVSHPLTPAMAAAAGGPGGQIKSKPKSKKNTIVVGKFFYYVAERVISNFITLNFHPT